MKIAFFGHDASDAAVRRRCASFAGAGHEVTGYMMRRDEDRQRLWKNVDLGRTYDGAYGQRLKAIWRGAGIAAREDSALRQADLVYARNLDMLICAMMVRRRLGLEMPVIYECLDVHHLLSGRGLVGMSLRGIERQLLRQTQLLVYSSPAFEREYFARRFAGLYTPYLLENRLVPMPGLPPRPQAPAIPREKLRLGWFGILRCARSLDLLMGLADQFRDDLEIVIRGIPAETQVPGFHDRVAVHENVMFEGAYQAPQDLASLYAKVDLVWAGDFYQAGYNSKWLLPNRLYEGGYFATPPIAPGASETGAWISRREAGFTLPEPLEVSFPALIQQLLKNPEAIMEKARTLLALPDETFVQPNDEIEAMLVAALGRNSREAAA